MQKKKKRKREVINVVSLIKYVEKIASVFSLLKKCQNHNSAILLVLNIKVQFMQLRMLNMSIITVYVKR